MTNYDTWVPEHDGKCDCGCGEHSVWTIMKLDNGKRRWFLTREHLHRWEAEREAQRQQVYAAFPFLTDPCYRACLGLLEMRRNANDSLAGGN